MLDQGTLVLIDLQPIFRNSESPWATPGFGEILPLLSELGARAKKVIATRFVPHEHPFDGWLTYYERWDEVRAPRFESYYSLVEEVAGLADLELTAPTFSKWEALAPHIEGDMYVAGVATECCVLSTVLGGVDGGARVKVLGDLCRGASPSLHEAALLVMSGFSPQCEVISVSEIHG